MSINLNGSVAAEIRALMARKGHRQKDLCQHLGMSPSALSARLNGKAPMTIDEVVAICEWMGVDPVMVVSNALEPVA